MATSCVSLCAQVHHSRYVSTASSLVADWANPSNLYTVALGQELTHTHTAPNRRSLFFWVSGEGGTRPKKLIEKIPSKRKKARREGGCGCVCNPCSHRDPDGLFSHRFSAFVFQQGDHPCAVSDGPTKRPQYMRISGLISQTYLPFSESSEWHEAKPRTSQVATFGSPERTSSCRLDRRLRS